MNRAFGMRLLAATLVLAVAGPGTAFAQPAVAEPAKFDDMAQCAIDKHPNEARWFGALLAKKVSVEPEVGGGAFLNAMGELLNGCMVDGSHLDFDAFLASLRRFGESAPTGPARPAPMDALGDCFLRFAPQEAMAFLRESDIEAGNSFKSEPDAGGKVALKMGSISNSAFEAMLAKSLSKSSGCGPILEKLGDRVHGNQVYWRLNWRLRAEPKLGAGK
jgi:hypothetical protein